MIATISKWRNFSRLRSLKTTRRVRISTISYVLLLSSIPTTQKRRTTTCRSGTLLSSCPPGLKTRKFLTQLIIIRKLTKIIRTLACSKWCRLRASSWWTNMVKKILTMISRLCRLTPSAWRPTKIGLRPGICSCFAWPSRYFCQLWSMECCLRNMRDCFQISLSKWAWTLKRSYTHN